MNIDDSAAQTHQTKQRRQSQRRQQKMVWDARPASGPASRMACPHILKRWCRSRVPAADPREDSRAAALRGLRRHRLNSAGRHLANKRMVVAERTATRSGLIPSERWRILVY